MTRLRAARPEEAEAISELCLRSKATWGYDEAFMAACRDELTVAPEELDAALFQIAERDGRILGAVQIGIEGRQAELEKLFVDPEAQGDGLGAALFAWALKAARAHGAEHMIIDSDPGAVPFYRRMGAREIGEAPSASIPGRLLPRLRLALDEAQSDRR